MAHKWLECIAVEGSYSKARIGMSLMGAIFLAFIIWLIVLSVQIGNMNKHGGKGI